MILLLGGDSIPAPNKVIAAVGAFLESFSQVASINGGLQEEISPVPPRWCKPSVGKWKINWNVAINKSTMKMGIGVVIRDEEGSMVAASARTIPYILDPPSAEAMGAWAAVLLGRDVGGTTIILEGDSIIGSGVSIVKRGFKQRVYAWPSTTGH
jgi:hypothetical protein